MPRVGTHGEDIGADADARETERAAVEEAADVKDESVGEAD